VNVLYDRKEKREKGFRVENDGYTENGKEKRARVVQKTQIALQTVQILRAKS